MKSFANLCLLIFICSFCFLLGRHYRLRDCLFFNYKGRKTIFKNQLFPDCMDTEYFIEMYEILHGDDKTNFDIVKDKLNSIIDDRIKHNRERAINRAVNSEDKVSKKIWETLNKWDKYK